MSLIMDLGQAEKVMNDVIAEMTNLTGFDRDRVVLEEAAVILKTCAARTPVAKPAAIVQRARMTAVKALSLNRGDLTVNAGLHGPAGRVWARSHGPRSKGKFRMAFGPGSGMTGAAVPYHWTTADWRKIRAKVQDFKSVYARILADAKRSAGLARQSWVQIADKIGVHLETVPGGGHLSASQIDQARAATSSRGRHYQNGTGMREKDDQKFFVTLVNGLPFGRKLKFDTLLTTVIEGRAKYFATSVRLGVFQSMDTIAKRYPGFFAKAA